MRSLRLPSRTVRLQLALLYGSLFLASGAVLLAITYSLMSQATKDNGSFWGPNGAFGKITGDHPSPKPAGPPAENQTAEDQPPGSGPAADALYNRFRDAQLHQLLVQSGIALAGMSAISVGLGWVVAGRVLRRLRIITTTARDISATNLHERLALPGPDDELKQLGDTIDELLARLETSFQSQHQFIANASHELRTPLARQRTLAQVALDDPDATIESLRAAHERVLAAGTQQERLIAALLTLARGQAGIEVQEPFDLAELVSQAVEARESEAARRSLAIRTALAPALTAGDPRLAERLVANLVDNALRHNVPGGVVEVCTRALDGRAVLSVANTGPVVPMSAVNRLFEPFQRLEPGRASRGDGLGLGLSIVQAVAEAHHATVQAAPQLGGGLAIHVSFPSRNGHTTAVGSTPARRRHRPDGHQRAAGDQRLPRGSAGRAPP
jgi:signal transduction histidine kinase